MNTIDSFIGRKKELAVFKKLVDSKKSTIAVVYGRRRVGKTFLIQKALTNKSCIFFEGLEDRPKKEQISNFLFQFQSASQQKVQTPFPDTWREAFLTLYKWLEKHPSIIVFDEFQWMANYRRDIISDLKMMWDQYFSKIPGVHLILCGSIASFMIQKVLRSKALYGRVDQHIHLKPFKIYETAELLGQKGSQEILDAHLLTGGVPKYLQLLTSSDSIVLGVNELAFSEGGYLYHEFERIFISHFGKTAVFEKIIRLLAAHPHGFVRKQLSEKLGVQSGGQLTKLLDDLETAGFIRSQSLFNSKKDARNIKYVLCDSFLLLYFNFIEPNKAKVAMDMGRNVFAEIARTQAYLAFRGLLFELFCNSHAELIVNRLGFSAVDFICGPYFILPKNNQKGVQIDLLFDRADNVLTLCEMKYTQKKPGTDIIKEVSRKCEILQNKFPKKTIQPVLISVSPPSKKLKDTAYFFKIILAEELVSGQVSA
jgi:AAA+ ATPase superfamily predicted ATPase